MVGNYSSYAVGINIPETKMPKVGVSMSNWTDRATIYPSSFYPNSYRHVYLFTAVQNNGGHAFRPADMHAMDSKMDDGHPATRNITVGKDNGNWWNDCTTTNDPQTAAYRISDNAIHCTMYWNAGF